VEKKTIVLMLDMGHVETCLLSRPGACRICSTVPAFKVDGRKIIAQIVANLRHQV
jgi:hypothetical protein